MSDRIESFQYEGSEGIRLDKYLVECLPEFSRARLQALIKDGFVLVDGNLALKAGQSIDAGALVEVRIPPPAPSNLVPEAIALDVIYEDQDVLVVNKPAGMVVHPAAGHYDGTLVHAALAHAPEMTGVGGEQRPGVVHRLDKNTSGVILLAKNDQTHRWLQDQFRLRRVEKMYLALVEGKPPTPDGRIEAPIGRATTQRKMMAVVTPQKGRQAISEYHTRETFKQHTLLEVYPHTGRTHQIRLHMKFIGCPVVGDTIYGRKKTTIELDRHFLHAARVKIILPGKTQTDTFEAPIPPELAQILEELRQER